MNNALANTINYFSAEGMPWLLLSWVFIYIFRPISTIFHELGHFLPACFLADGPIRIKIGEGINAGEWTVGRFSFGITLSKISHGTVSYEERHLDKWIKIVILLGGPLSSLTLVLILSFFLTKYDFIIWIEVMLVGLLCSNFSVS